MTLRISIAVVTLIFGFLAPAPNAVAQDITPHVEECTTWGFIQDINYDFGVVNTCAYPIEVWFLSGSGAQAHGQAPPGGTFSTGLTTTTADLNQWISASCRIGYRPSIDVSVENGDAIVRSEYNCVRS